VNRTVALGIACCLVAGIVIFSGNRCLSQEPFDFYGLRFGMTKEEVNRIMPVLGDGTVREPGNGMSSLNLRFDREGRLLEIRAQYPRPEDPLRLEGLRRAVKEAFVLPLRSGQPDINATMDEYGNRAALTLVLMSKGIREQNIEHYKEEYRLELLPPQPSSPKGTP